jgi:hypothetical protein
MASPARPAPASVSGAFGLSADPKRCSFDQALRQKVPAPSPCPPSPRCCPGFAAGE